jgi:hypothetical protein
MDELNNLTKESYFGEIGLSRQQYEERVALADDLETVVLFMYNLLDNVDTLSAIAIATMVAENYVNVVSKYVEVDEYIRAYAVYVANSLVEATLNNKGKEYYTSYKRAVFVACEEAQAVFNHTDHTKALKQGKTKKQWVDKKDWVERESHREVGSKIIDINKPFLVGDSLMMHPKDRSMGADAKEIINCRCRIRYL